MDLHAQSSEVLGWMEGMTKQFEADAAKQETFWAKQETFWAKQKASWAEQKASWAEQKEGWRMDVLRAQGKL